MDKRIDQNPEFIGYQLLFKFFYRMGSRLIKIATDINFILYRIKFGQRDDDIHIVTYPKSGTTMMQMILYHLTTDGRMDFKHIYDVSPWIRNHAINRKEPIELPSPRIIKSHESYKKVEKLTKGRFIFVYRNGMDVAISQFNQGRSYINPNLEFSEFLREFLDSKSNDKWFRFNRDWFKNKWKRPILYIRYEDLLSNKRQQIERIVEFCKLNVDEQTIARAIEYSSFDYMKKNETKFGEQPPSDPSTKVYDQFIRKGKIGEGDELFNTEQKAKFNLYYDKFVKQLETKIFPVTKTK